MLDTVSIEHAVDQLVNTLKVGGTYVLIGAKPMALSISNTQMTSNRQTIEGSLIGGVPETQEMLDFCDAHNIKPNYNVIHAKDASAQFQAMMGGTADAQRAVIDIATLKTL